ncbi:MAG: GNAT family N-acetyltransferase [Bacillota bacterium]|nr:GNAT family N-acetyltransferase [Bacillota bacterium]
MIGGETAIFRFGLVSGEEQTVEKITASVGVFSADEVEIALELARESVEKGPERSGYHFALYEADSNIMGYTCFGPIPCTKHSYDLYWIVVLQEYRGGGIGKKLFAATEERIREMNGKKIYVETSSRAPYLSTRQFYEKIGYTQEAVFKDFYDDGDDKVVYVKDLRSPLKTDL